MTAASNPVGDNSNSQLERLELSCGNYPITSAHSNAPMSQGNEDEKSHTSNVQNATEEPIAKRTYWKKVIEIISWTPPRCRWDPENPSRFGLPLNILFAFSGTFTV